VARFRESLTVIKRLWTEERVSLEGDFFQLTHASMQPKPKQAPHPPIWFGVHHPDALRRAVEMGDGFIGAGSVSTATFLDELRTVRDLLGEAGRDPQGFAVGKRVYMAVDADRGRALSRLQRWFAAFYKMPEMAEKVCVWGSAADCVEQLNEITGAGVPFLLLNPVFDEMEHLERLASDVIPYLVV
jgi:alkanesulfonate monooxygenase SsuD/methylene tetrahydromethanopterin reductase-like flavin-dependent oxidoreductase (luciferase family)